MRQLFLSLALIPAVCIPAETNMCFRDVRAEAAYQYQQAQEKCLATMIYGEARGETKIGQIAVAYSAFNRAVNRSVCDVILAPKQYSIFNGNRDLIIVATSHNKKPNLKNKIDKEGWKSATEVANLVLNQKVADPTSGATHYVAYKSLKHIPKWTYKLKKVITIQNHTFFKETRGIKIQSGNLSEKTRPLT